MVAFAFMKSYVSFPLVVTLIIVFALVLFVNADLILPVFADEILPVSRQKSVEANGPDA